MTNENGTVLNRCEATASGGQVSSGECGGEQTRRQPELDPTPVRPRPSDSDTFTLADTAAKPVPWNSSRNGLRPGDRLGRFVLVRLLGIGGMGEVWEADEPAVPRKVAIKVMRVGFADDRFLRQRFLREVRAQASVTHPNVVPLYATGEHEGMHYFAMALLTGETLRERLNRVGHLPAADVIRIGRRLAEGLEAIHRAGLVHRDLKPGNVGLNAPYDAVMVLDFGIVQLPEEGEADDQITLAGMVIGTPAYMAPEQIRTGRVDARADLFSLGVILYEMATGVRPFHSDSGRNTAEAVLNTQPLTANLVRPDVPPLLAEVIDRLLAKDPTDRWPATAAGVAAILAQLESHEDATIALPPRKGVPAKPRRWPFALLAFLFILIPAGWLVRQGFMPTPTLEPTPPPTAEDRLREFVGRLRNRPIDRTCEDVTKNGLLGNMRKNTHHFSGMTGAPMYSDIADGKATVRIPFDGEYERKSIDLGIITIPETKTARGVIAVTVVIADHGVRATDFEQVETDGQVTDRGHNAQKCAKAAVVDLVVRESVGPR